MKSTKKIVCIVLVLICVFALATNAMAATVVGGNLRLRKTASESGTIIGWLANGSTVSVTGSANATFSAVSGYAWQHSSLSGWYEYKSGYAMKAYLS